MAKVYSIVAYLVEHEGDNTDSLSELIAGFDMVVRGTNGVTFKDSTLRFDVPKSMILDWNIPTVAALHKANDSTFPKENNA